MAAEEAGLVSKAEETIVACIVDWQQQAVAQIATIARTGSGNMNKCKC